MVIDYLNSKNIKYKLAGKEAILKCPQCGKEKLSINIESGVYQCWRCVSLNPNSIYAKGHISQLKKEWGDIIDVKPLVETKEPDVNFNDIAERYSYDLFNASSTSKSALRYLVKNRKLTEETIRRFKLGVTRRYHQNWISMPAVEDGIVKLIKYRKLPPYEEECSIDDKCIREPGGKSILFNGDCLKEYDEVFILEGEIDTMTLIQQGYENVVGSTAGCDTLLDTWYDKLYTKNRFMIVFDTDDKGQGQLAARDVWATRLGIDRSYNILLPDGYDVNDFFLDHVKDDFDKLITESRRFKVQGVVSLKEALSEMYTQSLAKEGRERFALPWPSVNKMLDGGLARKRLTVLGAFPGVGKTSYAMQILWYFAKEYKLPGFMFCMEMPEIELAIKVLQLEHDLTYKEINYSDGLIYALEIGELPLYFGYSSKVTPTIFRNTMEEVRNRYGVQIGVFDNLQRMIRSGEESDIAKASAMFKDITMDLNIPFILISQPRKRNGEERLTYEILKGSSAIPQDADEVILLHRRRLKTNDKMESALESKCRVIVDKGRFSSGGGCYLDFVGEKSVFKEYEKEEENE